MSQVSPKELFDSTRTLLIGTCRVKRPRSLFIPEIASQVAIVRSHVHYPAEVLQMLRYLSGEISFPLEVLPLVIDDINNGTIKSIDELVSRREKERLSLASAEHVVLEISSLKKIKFNAEGCDPLFANITSVSNLSKGHCRASFIDLERSAAYLDAIEKSNYSEVDFEADLMQVLDRLDGKQVTLVAHFRTTIPGQHQPIAERELLGRLLRRVASKRGCGLLDQTDVVESIGAEMALKDTSHYTEAAEVVMAERLTAAIETSLATDRKSA